jgi:hypothetical protein
VGALVMQAVMRSNSIAPVKFYGITFFYNITQVRTAVLVTCRRD